MRAVLTRVLSASVEIDGRIAGRIGSGFLILLGVHEDDTEAEAKKIAGKMNLAPDPEKHGILIISQFTLFADCRSRRPGFSHAARPEKAIPLYELVIAEVRARGFHVETGEFGAEMFVSSVNDGPVTILFDTKEL